MRTDLKLFLGTKTIKVMSRNAADVINRGCRLEFVKGNTYYNGPDDLHITETMFNNLINYLVTGQTELNVKIVLPDDDNHPLHKSLNSK